MFAFWDSLAANKGESQRPPSILVSILACIFVSLNCPSFSKEIAPYHSVVPDELKTTYYRPGDARDDRDNEQSPARLDEFWTSLKEGRDVKTAALKTLSHFGGRLPIHFYGPDPKRPAMTEHIVVWDIGERTEDEIEGIPRGYVHLTVMQPIMPNPQKYVAFYVSGKAEQ